MRQVSTGPSAVIVTSSMAEVNFLALKEEGWSMSPLSYSAMPPLNFTSNPLDSAYDAFKYASDYSSGRQKAYAGMVAYRFKLPDDSQASSSAAVALIEQVEVSLHVDRWLIGGVRVAAYTSDDDEPSTDWDTLRFGDAYAANQLPDIDPRSDQNKTVTVDFFDSSSATVDSSGEAQAQDFLWVVVSLEDYESTSPLDSRRLEGGAQLVGESIAVTFSRTVDEDTEAVEEYIAQSYYYGSEQGKLFDFRVSLQGGNTQTPDYPSLWWEVFAEWAEQDWRLASRVEKHITDLGRAALRRVSSPQDAAEVHATYHVKFGSVGRSVNLKTLFFENALPAPSAGVVLRLVVYATEAAQEGDSPDGAGASLLEDEIQHDFWAGRVSTITFKNQAGGTFERPATVLLSEEISEEYDASTAWSIDWTPSDFYSLVVVVSPERITSEIGSAVDTWYGIDWTPGDITLKP